MSSTDYRDPRLTEQRNPRTVDVDTASSLGIVDLMHREDKAVPDAVHRCRVEIARVIDLAATALGSGGRIIYAGAGTSGRLGVLDASECPPTFGSPPGQVVGIMAGGVPALTTSQEGVEDDGEAGARAIAGQEVSSRDLVVGIAASGTTPFVRAALVEARRRQAHTALVTCAAPEGGIEKAVDVVIAALVGPEVLTGSTRLKAGTATKLILNMISTGAMIRSGKAYGNLMVDLVATSAKLRDRSERIVMEVCSVTRDEARHLVEAAHGRVKTAIVMRRRGVDLAGADALLAAAGGRLRDVIGAPPSVSS